MTTENKNTINLENIIVTDELLAALQAKKKEQDEKEALHLAKIEEENRRKVQEKGVFYSFEKEGEKVEIKGLKPSTFIIVNGMVVLCARVKQSEDGKYVHFLDGDTRTREDGEKYTFPIFEPATGVGELLKINKSCLSTTKPTPEMVEKRSAKKMYDTLIKAGLTHDEAVKAVQSMNNGQ